ncbi:MAG: hypothetical protein V1647_03180 [Pseudomonadota bacterium]
MALTYAIRDNGPADGWVFYDKGSYSNGWRYLEAAPSDASSSAWSNVSTSMVGCSNSAIGAGATNTTQIINQSGHSTSAAKLCADLSTGGYSDWFLPSKDELNKIWVNLKRGWDESNYYYTPVGDVANAHYWSSTEYSYSHAEKQGLWNSGVGGNFYKYMVYNVRCVRAF